MWFCGFEIFLRTGLFHVDYSRDEYFSFSWTGWWFTTRPLDYAVAHWILGWVCTPLGLLTSTNREFGSYIPVQQLEETLFVIGWDERSYRYGVSWHVNDTHKFSQPTLPSSAIRMLQRSSSRPMLLIFGCNNIESASRKVVYSAWMSLL